VALCFAADRERACCQIQLIVSAALGIWLVFAPAVLGSTSSAADSDHLVGALIASFSVIAWAEVIRAGPFINVLFGGWIIAAPWLLNAASISAKVNDLIVGFAVLALSMPRGLVRDRYANWDWMSVLLGL
jgi:hypothetical protein